MRAEKIKTIITILLLLVSTNVLAQQRTFYDANGRVTGRQATHSQGSKTIYDASGRVTGRTSTDSQGTTAIYDASGRKIGSTRK
jgi:YD repeat-containing protein